MKYRLVFGIIIGFILASTISVSAVLLWNAKDVVYEPEDTSWNIDRVQDALNDLYKRETTDSICPEGFNCDKRELFYHKISSLSKGKLYVTDSNNPFASIAGCSTSGCTTDNSNTSGVWEYDETLGANSDGGNKPIYYYRGVVDNNVLFANYCWKIIRTTSTGGIKMIYNGVPTNNTCSNKSSASRIATAYYADHYNKFYYLGYSYNTTDLHGVGTDSTIKKYIENTWFPTSNFAGENNKYYNMLEDVPFCEDRTYNTDSEATSTLDTYDVPTKAYYGGYIRAYNTNKPTLNCAYNNNATDTDLLTVSGGQLNVKMGLITSDEMILAGNVNYNIKNYSNYLYSGESYYTMTPYSWTGSYTYVFFEFTSKPSGYDTTHSTYYGIRPVISLSKDALYLSGDGTENQPYQIII